MSAIAGWAARRGGADAEVLAGMLDALAHRTRPGEALSALVDRHPRRRARQIGPGPIGRGGRKRKGCRQDDKQTSHVQPVTDRRGMCLDRGLPPKTHS